MHVIDTLQVGGAERMLVDLANATHTDGHHRVSVCVTRHDTPLASALDPAIQVFILNRTRRFDFLAMRRIAQIVREQRVDLFHAHMMHTLSFLGMMRMLNFIHTPIILHHHKGSALVDPVPSWFAYWGRFLASQVVGVSSSATDSVVCAGMPSQRVHTIPNAIDISRFPTTSDVDLRVLFALPSEAFVGITVAGLRHEKGIDTLIQAVQHSRYADQLVMIVAGGERQPNYLSYLAQLAQDAGVTDRIRFIGERRDLPALLPAADFAVMPSRSESGPLVTIEYLLSGRPMVSTRAGEISVLSERAGVEGYIAPDDPQALARALDKLLSLSEDERRRQGQKNRKIAEELFDVRRILPQWYATYEQTGDRR